MILSVVFNIVVSSFCGLVCTTIKTDNRSLFQEMHRPQFNLKDWGRCQIKSELIQLKQWRAPRRTTPGGQPKYSNIAIETCLTLRTIYKLPLRQTQGLMRSIARLMGLNHYRLMPVGFRLE